MTYYDFLLAKRASGELKTLFALGLPVHLALWMDYYEFYLEHPEFSYREISYYFQATKSTIERALAFMKLPCV